MSTYVSPSRYPPGRAVKPLVLFVDIELPGVPAVELADQSVFAARDLAILLSPVFDPSQL